jgi:hypothetical protein
MAGQDPIVRRATASSLLVVFIALTLQAGFFHSCETAGHRSAVAVTGDHVGSAHDDHASVCTACLLTRVLAATELAHAVLLKPVECSEGIESAEGRLASFGPRVPTSARSPPGC